jgi:hypothetical protein
VIYAGHVLECSVSERGSTFVFTAGFVTCGIDDAQRLELSLYNLRTAYISILGQLRLAGMRRDSPVEWSCKTHRVIDTDEPSLAVARG